MWFIFCILECGDWEMVVFFGMVVYVECIIILNSLISGGEFFCVKMRGFY